MRKRILFILCVILLICTPVHAGWLEDIYHFFGQKTPAEKFTEKYFTIPEIETVAGSGAKTGNEDLDKMYEDQKKDLNKMFKGVSEGLGVSASPEVGDDGVNIGKFSEDLMKDKVKKAEQDLTSDLIPGANVLDDISKTNEAANRIKRIGEGITKNIESKIEETKEPETVKETDAVKETEVQEAETVKKESYKPTSADDITKSITGKSFNEVLDYLTNIEKNKVENIPDGIVNVSDLPLDIKNEIAPYIKKMYLSLSEWDKFIKILQSTGVKVLPEFHYKENGDPIKQDIMTSKQLSDKYKGYKDSEGKPLSIKQVEVMYKGWCNAIYIGYRFEENENKDVDTGEFFNNTEEDCNKAYEEKMRYNASGYFTSLVNIGDVFTVEQLSQLRGYGIRDTDSGKFVSLNSDKTNYLDRYEIVTKSKTYNSYASVNADIKTVRKTDKQLTYSDTTKRKTFKEFYLESLKDFNASLSTKNLEQQMTYEEFIKEAESLSSEYSFVEKVKPRDFSNYTDYADALSKYVLKLFNPLVERYGDLAENDITNTPDIEKYLDTSNLTLDYQGFFNEMDSYVIDGAKFKLKDVNINNQETISNKSSDSKNPIKSSSNLSSKDIANLKEMFTGIDPSLISSICKSFLPESKYPLFNKHVLKYMDQGWDAVEKHVNSLSGSELDNLEKEIDKATEDIQNMDMSDILNNSGIISNFVGKLNSDEALKLGEDLMKGNGGLGNIGDITKDLANLFK